MALLSTMEALALLADAERYVAYRRDRDGKYHRGFLSLEAVSELADKFERPRLVYKPGIGALISFGSVRYLKPDGKKVRKFLGRPDGRLFSKKK